MIVYFACRRSRLRDIAPLRLGAAAAGHELRVILWPWAFPLLLVAAVVRRWRGVAYLIISDKFPLDTVIARIFGRDCTRMLWNYADEWPARGTRAPAHKVCFFREPGFAVDEFVFGPQLPDSEDISAASAARRSNGTQRAIVFVGDVTTDVTVPRGVAWWREQFQLLAQQHGYNFYLRPEYESLISGELAEPHDRRSARLLAKNLLRLWIIEQVSRHFGNRLVLVGTNWRRFGLRAEDSLYSEPRRREYYRSAVVNLDCGSKSGDRVLYPRSSELISFAGGLTQVRCADSSAVFGERAAELSFETQQQLLACIEQRLQESQHARLERDAWLVQRLRTNGLLMQHSIGRILQHTDRSC